MIKFHVYRVNALYLTGYNGMSLKVNFRIWINDDDKMFVGIGRVRLLEQIIIDGSISKAAKALKMSYKKAWKLVDQMNETAEQPVVVSNTGGAGGGGTYVTEFGREMIDQFRTLEQMAGTYFSEYSDQLNQ